MNVPTDTTWAEQMGPALSEEDASRLVGVPAEELREQPGLLRIQHRDGQVVYPLLQFDDGRQVSGVAEVVQILTPALLPLTVAAWLTSHNRWLGRRPIDSLHRGDLDAVLTLARQLASTASH